MILSQEPLNLIVRILIAAALAAILGIERDVHGRQAGLRTHILVSVGAALFFILSTHISTFDVLVPAGFSKVTDPGRIAAQIVTGIGFLAICTTAISLLSLILLRWLERFYRKDIYRDLIVTIPNEVDVERIIESVKSKEIVITFFGFERDYETRTTIAKMSLRLFYSGDVDKISHHVVEKLEQNHIPLKSIKWLRP